MRGRLAKHPNERRQTARDLAAELKFILESGSQAGLPVPAARSRIDERNSIRRPARGAPC